MARRAAPFAQRWLRNLTRTAGFASTGYHRPGHRPRGPHWRPAGWARGKTIDRGSLALSNFLTQCFAATCASGLPSAEVCCFAGRVSPETSSSWKVPTLLRKTCLIPLAALAVLLSACASKPVNDPGGKWAKQAEMVDNSLFN